MGIFGFGVVLAPAVGPSVGGILVEWFGWRSIFFVVTPFCLLAMAMARRYLPVAAPGGVPVNRAGGRLDIVGLGLIAVAVLALLNGMVNLHGETMSLGLALLVCSVVATVGFVAHQRRGARPLMALGLFAHRPFSMGGLVAFTYGMGLFGSTYLVPVFMQEALHLPPSQAGAVLLPAGIVLALTIPVAGRLADRVPVSRLVAAGCFAGPVVLPDDRRQRWQRARPDHAVGRDRPRRPRLHPSFAQPRLDARPSRHAHLARLEHDQLPAPARRRGRHRPGRQRARVASSPTPAQPPWPITRPSR